MLLKREARSLLGNTIFKEEKIYEEVFTMEDEQVQAMKKDVTEKFMAAQETFEDVSGEEGEFLRKFSFICALSFDVYMKKLMIEKMIDELARDVKNTEESRKAESIKVENKKSKEK